MDREVFENKLKLVHGASVTLVGPFTTTKARALFLCENGHSWEAYPSNLIYGSKSGCRSCSAVRVGHTATMKVNEFEEILRARTGRLIHLLGGFENTKRKATFRCDAGHTFAAIAGQVAYGAGGCRKCATAERIVANTKPYHEAVSAIFETHADKIKMIGAYSGRAGRTKFECERGHTWDSSVHNVIVGRGCPSCARHGYDPSRPGLLYYLRVVTDDGHTLYKIGITNLSVSRRFKISTDRRRIAVVQQWWFDDGKEAAARELQVLKSFRSLRYRGPRVLRGEGNSELFEEDVLMLDRPTNHPAFMPATGTALSE